MFPGCRGCRGTSGGARSSLSGGCAFSDGFLQVGLPLPEPAGVEGIPLGKVGELLRRRSGGREEVLRSRRGFGANLEKPTFQERHVSRFIGFVLTESAARTPKAARNAVERPALVRGKLGVAAIGGVAGELRLDVLPGCGVKVGDGGEGRRPKLGM